MPCKMGKEEGSPLPAGAVPAALPSQGWADSPLEAPGSAVALQRFRSCLFGGGKRGDSRDNPQALLLCSLGLLQNGRGRKESKQPGGDSASFVQL